MEALKVGQTCCAGGKNVPDHQAKSATVPCSLNGLLQRCHVFIALQSPQMCKHRNQVVIGPSHSIDLNSVLSSVNASTKTQCVACTTGKLFCPQLSATTGYAESQATPCMPDVDNQTCMPNMLRSTREFLYSKLAPTRLSNIP